MCPNKVAELRLQKAYGEKPRILSGNSVLTEGLEIPMCVV